MGALFDRLRDDHRAFIEDQVVFFVATAPSSGGRVNLSPKGGDTVRVLDDRSIAYLDYTGSGAETIAHLRDDGRLTLMWCSFGPDPLILRASGRGSVALVGSPEFDAYDPFPDMVGGRAIVHLAVDRVQSSCGYGVPMMELIGERPRLREWAAGRSDEELAAYRARKNARSVDGLPAMEAP